ncbi:MAG TPA: hypothetical protein VMT54_21635 [Candidatus Cybelea sp.]|nr:hypothetical protein [Candidatus Cybelea sp.]
MKTFLIVVGSVVGLGIVVVVGLVIWGANQKVNMDDPQIAEKFKSSFVQSCVGGLNTQMTSAGRTVSEADTARFNSLCSCMADDAVAKLAKNGGFKLADLATHADELQKQMQESGQACAAKLGIQGN